MMIRWNRLNTLIPKRWILLLRYYIPFFKKPKPFYFTLRQFIDRKINNKKTKISNFSLFLEFLTILYEDSIDDKFRKKIICCILPSEVEYMEGKLRILTLLSDKLIEQDSKPVSAFFMDEVEKVLPFLRALREISSDLKKKVLRFYLHQLKADHPLYLDFLTEYFTLDQKNAFSTLMFSEEDQSQWRPIVIKKIKDNFPLYLEISTKFFTDNLQEMCSTLDLTNEERLAIIKKMYDDVPEEKKETWLTQWLENNQEVVLQNSFVNHLITCLFIDKSDISALILNRILKNLGCDRLNSFQILAIQGLLKISPIPKEYANVEKIFSSGSPALHLNKLKLPDKQDIAVSAKIQNFAIEWGIHSLHPIVQSIINKLPNRAESNSLHSYWGRFTNNRWVDVSISKYDQWKIIEGKIRKEYREEITDTIDKVLIAYGNLYSLLDLEEVKAKEIAEYKDKDKRNKEENDQEERRKIRAELLKNIKLRRIFNVSEELMNDLYEEANRKKSELSRQYGINFFHKNNEQARKEAYSEAQAVINWRKNMNGDD